LALLVLRRLGGMLVPLVLRGKLVPSLQQMQVRKGVFRRESFSLTGWGQDLRPGACGDSPQDVGTLSPGM
jgi:hypothetical protein